MFQNHEKNKIWVKVIKFSQLNLLNGVDGLAKWKEIANQLESLLKLKTYPIGLKLFKEVKEMEKLKFRRPRFTTVLCQLITVSRTIGWTIGITNKDIIPTCAYVVGLRKDIPEKFLYAASKFWFKNKEDCIRKYKELPRIPPEYEGLILSPLVVERIEPELVLIFGTPAQMMHIINGLQWEGYERFQMFSVGETACADSIAQAYITKKPAITIPCFGERRYGHVLDEEMIAAIPVEWIERIIRGMLAMNELGARYPFPFSGIQAETVKYMPQTYQAVIKESMSYDT